MPALVPGGEARGGDSAPGEPGGVDGGGQRRREPIRDRAIFPPLSGARGCGGGGGVYGGAGRGDRKVQPAPAFGVSADRRGGAFCGGLPSDPPLRGGGLGRGAEG